MTNPIPGADAERAAFEAEMRKRYGEDHFRTTTDSVEGLIYLSSAMGGAWNGWIAARAAAKVGANVAEIRDAVTDAMGCITLKNYDLAYEKLKSVVPSLAIAAGAPAETPKPLYFVRYDGGDAGWREASEEGYHMFSERNRRILYAAQPAPAPSAGADVEKDARNWPEDFAHDNGNYMNTCSTCKQTFFGHKRRVTCKECATSATALLAQFMRCAYPVAPEINARGYNWCEAWLDEAYRAAMLAASSPAEAG